MNRQLSMEFVRITEQAALKSGRLMGTGDKEGADQAAVDGMHEQFAKTPVSGTVDRKSTRLNSSHKVQSRMPSSA